MLAGPQNVSCLQYYLMSALLHIVKNIEITYPQSFLASAANQSSQAFVGYGFNSILVQTVCFN